MSVNDTISAVATALGEGSIGVIRISGPDSLTVIQALFKAKSGKNLLDYPKNTLIYGHIFDENNEIIDEVLVAFMPGPYSYTAEDVVEIQAHGGIQTLKAILALSYSAGSRPAEPGEFTKRAFLNGRIDLAQAEAVMDIIKARSEVALKLALQQQQGLLSQKMFTLRKDLVDIIVNMEAAIDYPEDDVEEVTYAQVRDIVSNTQIEIATMLSNAHTGKIVREGIKTVIVGKPNVGKSSLLNALLKEDRAIVSEIPGTTRDVIEEQIVIDGIPLVLVDTAGIRETEDYVEQIGVAKSKRKLDEAELVIVVLDGSDELQSEDQEILKAVENKEHIIIINKIDKVMKIDKNFLLTNFKNDSIILLSAKTSEGLEKFVAWLRNFAYGSKGSLNESVYVQNARHEYILKEVNKILLESIEAIDKRIAYDCIIIDLRNVINDLGLITGETVSDEIINEIFARFCLGK